MFEFSPLNPWFIAIIAVSIVVFTVIAIVWGIRAHRYQVAAGKEELIGKTAEALTPLEPKGTIFIEGERWTAISQNGRIEPGEEVSVTKVNGLKMWVAKKQKGD